MPSEINWSHLDEQKLNDFVNGKQYLIRQEMRENVRKAWIALLAVNSNLTESYTNLERVEKDNTELMVAASKQNKKILDLENRLKEEAKDYKAKLCDLEHRIDEDAKQLSDYKTKILKGLGVEKKLKEASETLEDNKRQIEVLQNSVKSRGEALKERNDEIVELEEVNHRLNEAVENYDKVVAAREKEIDELKAQNEELLKQQAKLDSLHAELNALITRYGE